MRERFRYYRTTVETKRELPSTIEREYKKISDNLKKVSNKKLDKKKKVELLEETKELEAEAIKKVKKVADKLRK